MKRTVHVCVKCLSRKSGASIPQRNKFPGVSLWSVSQRNYLHIGSLGSFLGSDFVRGEISFDFLPFLFFCSSHFFLLPLLVNRHFLRVVYAGKTVIRKNVENLYV